MTEAIICSKYVVSDPLLKHPSPPRGALWVSQRHVCGYVGKRDDLLCPSAAKGFPFFFHESVAAG